jgi:hypothetical protein
MRPGGASRAAHRRRRAGIIVLMGLAVVLLLACQPTLQQQTGIVLSVDSPTLGRVDSFELLNVDGEVLTFDTRELRFRPEFPAPHLAEHQVLGDRIVVTYRTEGDRLIVTQLDDAS